MNSTILANHLSVNYSEEGPYESPVIIFIHGFPFNKSMWKPQVEALKDSYRVITYDVRGHGDTETGNEDFSIELFVSDLLGLMDALNVQNAILCGLSMGGYIALRAIVAHPERFDALILSDTQCIADTPEAREKRMKTIASIKVNGVKKYADESVKNLFSPESFTTKQASILAIRKMIVSTSRQSLSYTLLALAGRKETCSSLSKIVVPTLIMVGNNDIITPPAAARMLHEGIHGSLLHIVQQAGHLPNLENPDDFNFQLKLFLHRFAKPPAVLNTTVGD
ncbi:MAG TPA: alpha/beta fold hydrolase [Saprospiraceae bacterium]|nr:alpha/beta fold hydrolase [Saprospiraceae bacterium]